MNGLCGRIAPALCALVLGCDVAEPGREAADGVPGADTVDTADAVDAVDTGEVADTAPGATAERVVSAGGGVGEARDDLFPDLAGDDLVWVRVWFDASVPYATADTDCLVCPYCTGCRFDIMHRELPDGPAEVLFEGHSPRSSPRVGEGVVAWLDDNGGLAVHDLATRSDQRVTPTSWIQMTPTPHAGKLWWYGYDYNGYGLISYDLASGITATELSTYINDTRWLPGSQLSSLALRQPFAVGADRFVWSAWTSQAAIVEWRLSDKELETRLSDADRQLVRVLLRGDGALVTFSYEIASGCQAGACDIAITAYPGSAPEPVAEDAEPSLYVPPVAMGERILWVDRRDGPYEVWGAEADGREVRLSSADAMIGALSPLAASDDRVVWADRRSGHWRLVARDW